MVETAWLLTLIAAILWIHPITRLGGLAFSWLAFWLWLCVFGFVGSMTPSAHAQQPHPNIEIAKGVLCDEAASIEKYTKLELDGVPPKQALATVNGGSNDCAFALAMIEIIGTVATVPLQGVVLEVIEVIVYAVSDKGQWLNVRPTKFYMGILTKDTPA